MSIDLRAANKVAGPGISWLGVLAAVAVMLTPLPSLAASGTSSPVLAESARADAEAIDGVLLMSALFVRGFGVGVEKSLHGHEKTKQIVSCVRVGMTPTARSTFASIIASGITSAQLKRGADLARSPAFRSIPEYILANTEALKADPNADRQHLDDYFLMAATTKLRLPDDQKRVVNEFVAWHQEVRPSFNQQFAEQLPLLLEKAKEHVATCLASN